MRHSGFCPPPEAALAAGVAALALAFVAPAHAGPPDGEAFVAAFGEVCIPERLSYEGTLGHAESLGWRAVVQGANAEYDRFIARAAALLAKEVAEDPDLFHGSDGAWFTRDVGGRPSLLAVSLLLTGVMDTLGCHLYDLAATAPIDPEPVTRLLDRPIAHTTDGGDPFYAVDPGMLVSTVWGPPPALPRTGDTSLTFIPDSSPYASEIGFSGLTIGFSTSLPSWEDRQGREDRQE